MGSVKKNFLFNIILTFSNMILPVITFPYTSRILGLQGTGLVNFVQSFTQYFILVAALGIPIYGIREIAKLKDNIEDRSRVFWEINLLRIATTIIILVVYFILILFFDKFKENLVFYYWGAFFIFINITAIEWFFIGLENFSYITTRSLFIKAISILFTFLLVKEKSDTLTLFLITIFSFLINGIININYANRYLTFNIKWADFQFKRHLKPLMLIFSFSLAGSLYLLMDTIMVGFLSSDKAVGLYTAALKITKLCLTIVTSLGVVLIPRLSYAIANNDQKLISRLLDKSINFVFTLGIPIMAGIYILAPELIYLFSGREFILAVVTMRILCPLIIVIGLSHIFGVQILITFSKDKLYLIAVATGAVTSLALNYLLIPYLAQNGAAITSVIAEIVVTTLTFILARKFIRIHIPVRLFIVNCLTIIPYFIIAYYARLFIGQAMIVVIITVLGSFITFVVCQVYLIKNQIILQLISNQRIKLKTLITST
jgi:O-antigen/teichoic acid export membrane protein